MPKATPFDDRVARYEAWFDRFPYVYRAELAALRELLPAGHGVEVGVGTGRFAAPLCIEVGIEPSPAMGQLAAQRGIRVVAGVAERLPFADASNDFLLMVNLVCFLSDPLAAFREARRVLKDNGALVVAFIDAASPLGIAYERAKGENPFYRDAVFRTPTEIAALFHTAGFSDLVFRQTLFRPLGEIDADEPVKTGHSSGSFVVVKGRAAPQT